MAARRYAHACSRTFDLSSLGTTVASLVLTRSPIEHGRETVSRNASFVFRQPASDDEKVCFVRGKILRRQPIGTRRSWIIFILSFEPIESLRGPSPNRIGIAMFTRLTFVLFSAVSVCSVLVAQEEKDPSKGARPPIFDIGEIEVPTGDVVDAVEFLSEMSQLRTDVARDYQQAIARISAAQTEASNLILDDPTVSDEHFAAAARLGLAARVRGVTATSAQEQRKTYELVRRQLSIGVKKGLQRTDISNASTLASYLERGGDGALAAEACKAFADLLKDEKNPAYRGYAERFEGTARRLALLGNPIELTGTLLDGSEFDWDSYRGKVVLVDFWATWCGPCIAEAPNVRKQYDIYHNRGFEVVGISLDTKKSALEAYLKKEGVPWVNLFQDGAGWKHSMAVKYGVSAIPTVFLVNRDGKVVSLRARGAELGKQLKKLLGTRADWERAIAGYNEQITADTADAQLVSRRAAAYVATEQWEQAKADWLRATRLNPALCKNAFDSFRKAERWSEATEFGKRYVEQKPEDAIRWLSVASVVALAGDDADFRQHCQGMLKKFADTSDGREARLTCKTCLLLPNVVDPSKLPQDTFVKSMENPNASLSSAWGWSIRAMLAYRSGDTKSAIDYLKKSDASRPVDFVRAANLPLLAMAHHQLGNDVAAGSALKQASQVLQRLRDEAANTGHHDLLIAQIMFDEAESQINGKDKPK
jgi:thiol-disulfide isomerase/thioredoxin